MPSTPVLLLAFNRPLKFRRLVESLRSSKPETILVAVDGPRVDSPGDSALVKSTQDVLQAIDWPCEIRTRFRSENLGLRGAVEDAVDWALSQFGHTIVIEDDTIASPLLVPYLERMLSTFARDKRVMHISGYNVVPQHLLTCSSGSRFSRYPESFAWATWERAWKHYDPELGWASEVPIAQLAEKLGSATAALRWKINFADAKAGRISTWAYRWVASIWSQGGTTIAPNQNLASYGGFDEGTHSFRKPRWSDLAVFDGHVDDLAKNVVNDRSADEWTGRRVFRESASGVADGLISSIALEGRKAWRAKRRTA